MRFVEITTAAALNNLTPKVFCLDLEATSKDAKTAQLLKVVISCDGETAYSIPAAYLPLVRPVLLGAELIIYQNFKYDVELLYQQGVDLVDVPFRDTMLMHHLIDENAEHGLDALVKHHFNDPYKETFWSRYESYEEAPKDEALAYECKDAIYTYRLYGVFNNQLSHCQALVDHHHRNAKALYLTERRGVRVDFKRMLGVQAEVGPKIQSYLPKLRQEFDAHCSRWELEKWCKEIDKRKTERGKVGVPRPKFNFASNTQVQWLLYTALGLPILKRTETKAPSTDYETIEKLAVEHPELETYKSYIELKTIYATFVEGLIAKVQHEDSGPRIYPSFNANGTVNLRISHSNPNMGNMPKEGPYRSFFLPDEGEVIGGADFSQLEVVIEANLTGDKQLAKIILEGASKHDITAQEMGIPRDLAKTINFGMGYRCGVGKLRKLLKCSNEEAEYQWNKYWEVYSGCRDLQLLIDAKVDAGEPIVNIFGFARHFPKEFTEPWMRDAAHRQAYNSIIQSPGAIMTNISFYRMSERLEQNKHGRMLWSVHDELVGSFKPQYFEEEKDAMTSIMVHMTQEVGFKIPLGAKAYGPLQAWEKA